ncbi:Autocrine proliferation repressor protein A [Lamellibrachia satsuma]|nr:Autocrine proliferation repressor protein A [Lamellibrachia satsuma]
MTLAKSFTNDMKEETLTLEQYVNRPDPAYSFREVKRTEDQDHTAYYLNMTSQKWMDENFSDKPVWWHDVVISVPRKIIVSDVAFLFVGLGHNVPNSIPTPDLDTTSGILQLLSVQMGIVTVYVKQIPNQPIVFKADPTKKSRSEDSVLAYLWRTFMDDKDASPEILPRYPMTKAIVRAMDTVTNFTRQVSPNTSVSKFVVAGFSKRGWTTWTTTAVDKRVIAQMPVVMSLLNFYKHMQRHQSSLGGWTFAFHDYYYENITMHLKHPRLEQIMDLVNPYSFIDKYTLPTMVVGGTADQFFLPDETRLFFSQLPGPKYFLMLPNRDHSLAPFLDVLDAMRAFTVGVATEYHFPQISWQLIETATGGKIVFNSSDVKPKHVTAWNAVTDTAIRRDFRANYGKKAKKSNIVWLEDDVKDQGDGIYVAEYDKVDKRWLAFLIQAKYDGPLGHPLTLTSEVNIIPSTFPYPPCYGEGCYETLV